MTARPTALPSPSTPAGQSLGAMPCYASSCGRVTLYHGEALDILPAIPKVDAIVTDPPYSITSEASSSVSRASRNVRETQFFEAWLREQVGALVMSCKPSAALWMSLDWRGAMVLDTVCAKLNLKEPKIGVWDKESIGMGGVLRNSYECFAVVTLAEWEHLTRSERDVWQHRWTQGNRASSHPAEKPVPLMERACKLLCKEQATVLDPYMGSGTTGIAAIRSNMRFVGIERDAEIYAGAVQRITDELAGDLFQHNDGTHAATERKTMSDPDVIEQPEARPVVACSDLLAAIKDIDQAWGEMLKFGNHEGDCGFDGECPKCHAKLGRCNKHAEHMAMRLNGMTAALNRARALAANAPGERPLADSDARRSQ